MKLQPQIGAKPLPLDTPSFGWFKEYFDNLNRLYQQLVKFIASTSYDITIRFFGKPTNGQLIFHEVVAHDITANANFGGSTGIAEAASTGTAVFNVRNGATVVGTITYSTGNVTPVFATTAGAPQFFKAGSLFAIDAPATADATLSGTSWVMVFTKELGL